ncbi:retinol dehydrogenase 13-like isoform X2 [Sinocyclocheilus anshuiensis]|uniref:retinol dehydrogenase 13-like isoform X2 n=1 Tax=Sinocyclocheilus anshuiensis TaxID=1608454 RepID=UPI0007BA0E13|nr:PREDICTED: retinol dehydrogenase 13-like isoform X2 [Sinocyclocheilus anshuiensis]
MRDQVTSSDRVNYGAVIALVAISFMLLRKWIAGGVCKSRACLDGKTVVITGANTGIGMETAKDMARRGARVVMACRDLTRAENAAEYIRRSTGNGNVVIRHLNLASLYSVQEFVKEFIATEERLDILINNAGKIEFDDLFFDKRPYSPLLSYKQSKLANVLFSRELARRMKGTGVSSYCLHPGVIRTELIRHILVRFPVLKIILSLPCILLMKTPWQGAQTSIYCAVTEGLESKSGCYFSDCAEKDPAPEGKDDEVARRLWEESAGLVGLNPRR